MQAVSLCLNTRNIAVRGGLAFSPVLREKENGPRIEWKYKNQEIAAAERSHGKYLLFSTDESLSPDEVVKAYFEKDFVEIGLPNIEEF